MKIGVSKKANWNWNNWNTWSTQQTINSSKKWIINEIRHFKSDCARYAKPW